MHPVDVEAVFLVRYTVCWIIRSCILCCTVAPLRSPGWLVGVSYRNLNQSSVCRSFQISHLPGSSAPAMVKYGECKETNG